MRILLLAALALAGCRLDRADAAPRRAPAISDGGTTAAAPVEAAAIGAGRARWVDSNLDPEFALINARVDIGTLKAKGDEIEVTISWPIGPGRRNDLAVSAPELRVPDGAVELERDRVRCGRDRLQYFAVETSIVGPAGEVLQRKIYDVTAARREEETRFAGLAKTSFSFAKYGRSPRDLVCWAVARKCEGKPFSWPPPPNTTRFDDPEYPRRRDAYDAQFVPRCKLQ